MKHFLRLFTLLLFSMLLYSPLAYAKNQLTGHYSPYLAMHGNDPVNWMEWSEATFEKARKEKKLIFVSIGYYACHWCHVMHKESYSNDDIAKILNDNYIAIKIDRELNPVLDKRLINFVQATTGTAGWPLNVFLTPEGYPLAGTTYVPKPQFAVALTRLQKQWTDNAEQLSDDAKMMDMKLAAAILANDNKGSRKHIAENQKSYFQQVIQQANTLQGGFSSVRQFPSAAQFLALLQLNKQDKKKHDAIDDFIQLTLDNMQNKGLHDEIAGGFYRYTVGPDWHTPHFEKMLYTNALLPLIYQDAAEQYSNDSYHQTALETMQFLLADMQGEHGAFIASLSAVDDKSIEGGYYLWLQDELKSNLTKEELTLANLAWGLNQPATLEAGNLPVMQDNLANLAKKLNRTADAIEKDLSALKIKLNAHRKQHRIIPRDDKLLAGWNGLTLTAFARMLEFDPSLKPAGDKLASFLISLWDGKQLKRAKASQKSGNLNDYAAVAWGLVHWSKASGDNEALKVANAIIDTAWQKFYSSKGWRESEKSLLPKPLYRQHIEDSPIPSSEALLIEATQLSGNNKWEEKLKEVLNNSTDDVENSPFSYAYLVAVSAYNKAQGAK